MKINRESVPHRDYRAGTWMLVIFLGLVLVAVSLSDKGWWR